LKDRDLRRLGLGGKPGLGEGNRSRLTPAAHRGAAQELPARSAGPTSTHAADGENQEPYLVFASFEGAHSTRL
jgi:hypothetical protein